MRQERTAAFDSLAIRAVETVEQARPPFEPIGGIIERVLDLAAAFTAELLAYFTHELLGFGKQGAGAIVGVSFAFAVVSVLMLEQGGVYKRANSLLGIRETERILRVSVWLFALILPVSRFLGHMFSPWILVFAVLFLPLLLSLEKRVVIALICYLYRRGHGVQNVLIYGAGLTGRRVLSVLLRSRKLGLNPVAIIDDDEEFADKFVYEYGYKRGTSAPVIRGPLTRNVIRKYGVSIVVVAIRSLPEETLNAISSEAFAAGARIALVPQFSGSLGTINEYVDLDGVLIASFAPAPSKWGYEKTKRAFDFVTALMLMALTAPLWAIICALVHYDSLGPVFFHQQRVGHDGKTFTLHKFRTMWVDAPTYASHPTSADDPRVTPLGRWLRRTSLDELPQLINVLRGDMSLVGPRPEMPFVVHCYNATHRERLRVVPGITGLWQLSADRAFPIHENAEYDLYYIRNRNFFMDLAILLHTVVFAMRGL